MHQAIRRVLTGKPLLISVTVALLYALIGFLAVPALLRWRLPLFAEHTLHCRAAVETIRINPFLLTIEIKGFKLEQADGSPLLAFTRFFVDLETSSLFRWAIVLQELTLEQPAVHAMIEPDGALNFERLAPASPPSQEAVASEPSAPLPILVRAIVVSEGAITLVDKRQSTPAALTLAGITLDIRQCSTIRDLIGTYHLAAMTADGETIRGEGEFSLVPFRSKGNLAAKALRTASLWQFGRDSVNVEQPAGTIDLATAYDLDTASTPAQVALTGLHLSASDLSFRLRETETPFFRVKNVELSAPSLDLTKGQLHVDRLLLEEGAVDVQIDESGVVNMERIVHASSSQRQEAHAPPPASPPDAHPPAQAEQQPNPPPSAPSPPLHLRTDALEIRNLAVAVDDKSRVDPFKAAVAGVDLRLRVQLALDGKEPALLLEDMAAELKGLRVDGIKAKEPLFAADTLSMEGGTLDLQARSMTLARVALHKGHFDASRESDGTINWQRFGQARRAGPAVKRANPGPNSASAWKFLVKSFEVEDFASRFTDLTTRSDKPVCSVHNLNAKLTGIDGRSPMGIKVGFQVEQGGTATVNGTVHPLVPAVEADVNLAGVALMSLQPYLEPFVNLQMQSALVSARGHLEYGLPTTGQPPLYEGSFSLNNLRLIDSTTNKPSLSWDAFQVSKCRLTLHPNRLDVQEILVAKPVGEIVVGQDKILNLAKAIKAQPVSKPSPAAKSGQQQTGQDAFNYQIAKVRVEGGNVVFADLSLRPQFVTRIHDLKGTVSGLSSARDAQAKVQMDGQVDRYGTAKISGVLRPSDFAQASDVNLVFRNLEMKNLSPYSGRFAGRLIKSGKISADLSYTLQNYKMTGENKIVIDNLFLGDKVEDPEAANLPLDLAIALLKDASGRIDIGLPVTGDLNDPQFSIGSLVWKVLTNLITKATTAPFRALGGLLGDDSEQFGAVGFDPGSHELAAPEKEKLAKLVDALKSRPQLKLVVQGRYSPEVDGLELRERSLCKTVATRLGAEFGSDDAPEPLDFTDSGIRTMLEKLYAERFGKASLEELEKGVETGEVTPRMPVRRQEGKQKESGMFSRMVGSLNLYKIIPGGKSPEQSALWAGELYTRLVEREKVADKALHQLAEQRAQSIAAYLESQPQIPKDRVNVKAPEPVVENEPPSATLSLEAL